MLTPAAQPEQPSIEQQAVKAMVYLSDEDKKKVLEYVDSLLTLEKAKNDQGSAK